MDMNKEDHIATLPKKGLKTRPYNMDMNKEDQITTLPKRGLKTRPYNMDMNMTTLPKKGLKTRPYNMDMEKKDLKKRTKGQLIKLLMNQQKNEEVESIKNQLHH